MINQSQIKVGGIAIILLALLNICLLAYFVLNKPNTNRPMGPGFGPRPGELRQKNQDARNFIIKELSFSEAQISDFDSLRKAHLQLSRQINQENHKLRKQYFDHLMNGVPSSETEIIAEEIGSRHTRIEKAIYKHFEDIRNLCNQTQEEKFDHMIREIFRMMMPPPGPGPGMRPGRKPGSGPGPRPERGPHRP